MPCFFSPPSSASLPPSYFTAVCSCARGIAVVRRDGSDASRWRMLWRACLAWSWLPVAVVATAMLNSAGFAHYSIPIFGLPILCVVACSAAMPRRSLQDRLAGTWPVPR